MIPKTLRVSVNGREWPNGKIEFVHLCETCGKDAPFGTGVRLKDGKYGKWYCREHIREAGNEGV
jgi:hypothetical protein